MRLGFFGGSFDPIHNGHIAVADGASRRFALDRLLWAPSEAPPHKRNRAMTDPFHRFAMTALAVTGRPDWIASTIDIEGEPPHYSVETIARLHARIPGCAPIYFVMGADSFADLHHWREHERLVASCHIVVSARPGHDPDASNLSEAIRERIVDLRSEPIDTPVPAEPAGSTRIYLTSDSAVDISSTAVREAARAGRPLVGVVPDRIAEYILKQELYTSNPNE